MPANKMPKSAGLIRGVFSKPAAEGASETQAHWTLDDMRRVVDTLKGTRVCTEHSPDTVGTIERAYIDSNNQLAGVVRLYDTESGTRALRRCANREYVGFSIGQVQTPGSDSDGLPIVKAKDLSHVALTSNPEFPEHTLFECVQDADGRTLFERAAHSVSFSSATAGMSVDELDARIGELQRARDAQLLNRREQKASEKTPSDQQQATNSMQSSAPAQQQPPQQQQQQPSYPPPQQPQQQQQQAPPPPYNYPQQQQQQQQPFQPQQQQYPHGYPYAPAQTQPFQAPPPMNIPSSTGFGMQREPIPYPGNDGVQRRSDGSQFLSMPDSHINRSLRENGLHPQQHQQPAMDPYQMLAQERYEKSQLQEQIARMNQRKRTVDHDDYDENGRSASRDEEMRQRRPQRVAVQEDERAEVPAPVPSKEDTEKLRAELEAMRQQLNKITAAAEDAAKAKATAAAAEAADDDLDVDDKMAADAPEEEEVSLAKQLNALRVKMDGLRAVRSSLDERAPAYKKVSDPDVRKTFETLRADFQHNSESLISGLVDALAHFAAQQKELSGDGDNKTANEAPVLDESLRNRLVDIQTRKYGPTRSDLDYMHGVVVSHAMAANTLDARNAELQRMRQMMAEQRIGQQERQAQLQREATRRAAAARVDMADPKLPKAHPQQRQSSAAAASSSQQVSGFQPEAPSGDRAKTFVIGRPVSMSDVQASMKQGGGDFRSMQVMPAVAGGHSLLSSTDPEAQQLVAKLIASSHGTSRHATAAPMPTISATSGSFRAPASMPGGFEYTRDESIAQMYGRGNTRFFDITSN